MTDEVVVPTDMPAGLYRLAIGIVGEQTCGEGVPLASCQRKGNKGKMPSLHKARMASPLLLCSSV